MSSRDLSVALRLLADPSGLDAGLRRGQSSVKRFTSGIKREFDALHGAMNSFTGRMAQIGLGVSLGSVIVDSARLDKELNQTRQTAGETKSAVAGLRSELFRMGKQTGANVEDLKEGHAALIASGQSWKAATNEIDAINIGLGVTGANAKVLAGGLTVAGEAFQFDLEKPGLALELLDKMTVAGRKGNAELENLSDIFSRVGVNASSAGLGFEKTLGFIEALSLVERQPERLATLADSTLRLFNNVNYMETAQEGSKAAAMMLAKGRGNIPDRKDLKALAKTDEFQNFQGGVKFFDDQGGRRDPIAVLKDLRSQFRMLKTDAQRSEYLGSVFDKMDLDTIKGLKTLLQGDALDKIGDFETSIKNGVGTLKRDLPDALNNSVDQAGRLKNTLREAADGFAQPINKGLSQAIQYALDAKKLTGGELIAGGVATAGAAYIGGRLLSGMAGKILGGIGSTAGGVAAGKALQETAGVQPVFVVNMPAGGLAGGTASAATVAGAGAGGGLMARLPQVALGAGAAVGGYQLGKTINEHSSGIASLTDSISKWMADKIFKLTGPELNKANPVKASALNASMNGSTANGNSMARNDDKTVQAIESSGQQIEQKLGQFKPDMQAALNGSNLPDRISAPIVAAINTQQEKKAALTITVVGPARVTSTSATGFNMNVDSGPLPVGQ